MFYLEENFRNKLFTKLKSKYKDWRVVAKHIGIDPRHLFGVRRGFEQPNNKKYKRFISSREIKTLSKLSKINLKEFEKNIETVKVGTSGRTFNLLLPKTTNILEEDISSKYRTLAELIYIKKFKPKIKKSKINKGKYFYLTNKQISKIRNKNYKNKIIPEKIPFNETFAKEFGKWIGDRCGGSRKVGVSNKEIEFINSFKTFLINLNQESPKITLTLKPNFKPSKGIIKNSDEIRINKHQYGDYSYRTEVSNRILKEYVFDKFESNIFSLLKHSNPEIRYAFFAGLMEAEGSIDPDRKDITIAFGTRYPDDNEKVINTLKKALLYNYLLNLDNFNSRISRKYSNTKKSHILKYDIRIKNIEKFKEEIAKFITHPQKLKRINKLVKSKQEELQPEISIGLVGH